MTPAPSQYTEEHLETLTAMERFGGSFVVCLSRAWRRADVRNHAKLYSVFSDLYQQHYKLSQMAKERNDPTSQTEPQ